MMTKVIHPNQTEFDTLINHYETVFVDFYATWCGPCKMLAPEIEKLADEYGDKVPVVKIDVDKEAELAQRYGIVSIPTLILFKNGRPYKTEMGFHPYPQLKALLES